MAKRTKVAKWLASFTLIVVLDALFGDLGLIAALALIYLLIIN